MQARLTGLDPGHPEPELPHDEYTCRYDLSISPECIVERWEYDLCRTRFLGDAFPTVKPFFGAGAAAAFLGADIHNTEHTSWFVPKEIQEIADLDLPYLPNDPWFQRARDVTRAAIEHFKGSVQVAMVDLGGTLDVLSTFRPSNLLLMDLYDSPDDVERLNWQIHEGWFRLFDEFNQILQPVNPAYTAWTPLFSEVPYYMFQCDFCYMIGPEQFERFVKPEIAAACRAVPNAFYHLDGPDQLTHLDSLLEIDELTGIQWVPGGGVPEEDTWPHVYRRIRDAGKLVQIGVEPGISAQALERIVDQLGSAEGLAWIYWGDISEEDVIIPILEKFGAA